MELNILGKKENPSLHREEIRFEIKKAKTTPSRKEIREKMAAMCNAETELVVVGKISHSFGEHYVVGSAKIYKSKEHMNEIETKYVLNRNLGLKKKEKAAEAKQEIPAKPAEGAESKQDAGEKPRAGDEKSAGEKAGKTGQEGGKDKDAKEGE